MTLTSMVRIGSWMMGPLPEVMSKGMFMPVRGVRMSEKRMTPSGWNARQGCSEISTCSQTRKIEFWSRVSEDLHLQPQWSCHKSKATYLQNTEQNLAAE